jgi:hypothetical protein
LVWFKTTPPPPPPPKKKTIVDFYSWNRCKEGVLVHQRSCLGSPYLHGFWNEWILLNVLTCCFKYSGSLSLFLADPQVQLMMELCCHPQRLKKNNDYLKSCLQLNTILTFFLSFCFGCNHLVGNHLQIYPLMFWDGSRPFGLIRT